MKYKYSKGLFGSFHYLGVIPVVLFIVLLVILHHNHSSATVFEPPLLLPVLNTIFVFFVACIISLVAMRTYLISGSPNILWFGSGVLMLGLGALSSAWVLKAWGPNVSPTIFNISVLISSLAHAIGVISSILDKPPESDLIKRKQKMQGAYLGVLAFCLLITVLSIKGLTPVFFIQGEGSTAIRDMVLMAAFVLFVVTSSFMMLRFIQRKAFFLYWYSLGLALLSIAMLGYIIQLALGSYIGWVSRSAQYLASIYFLIAIISAWSYVRTRERDLGDIISELFRSPGHLWQDILASVNDAVVSSDDKGKILLWNKAAEEIFGYKKSDLIGRTLDAILPELRLEELKGRTTEMELKSADGQLITAEVSGSKTSSSFGGTTTFVIRNTTERKRAESTLKQQAKLLEHAPVLVRNINDEIILWNKGMEELYGFSSSEALGKVSHDLLNTAFPQPLTEIMAILREKGEWNGELEHNKKDGTSIIATSMMKLHTDENGKPSAIIEINHDVTWRKRVEEDLRYEKLRLEVAQESAQAGTFEWNIQKSETIWSDQLKALYGFAPGEFKGFENWSSRVHPEDLRKSKKAIVESLRTGKYDDDFRVIWPDGSLHWLAARGRVVFDEHGSPLLMTGINMDVTERKRAEEALTRSRDELEDRVRERTYELSRIAEELRNSEEAYRLLVELNPVGVFRHVYDMINKKSKRLHCNDAQLNLLGYSSLNDYLNEDPKNTLLKEHWNYYISTLISEGKVVNFPAQMKRKDGRIIWVLLNAITRSDGKHLFIEGAMTDIGEQKRTEERLRSAQKMLRAMAAEIVMSDERSRQHFATDLHDTVVQTLGAAKLRSQLIQESIPPEAKPIYTELQDMISQSITQSRFIMAEMSPPVLYELGFVPALEWLTEQIESQHGIPIVFTASNGSQTLIHEIQVLLFQATRELLMNVVKHSRAESAIVKLSNNGNHVRIEVTDNGSGFDKRQAFRTDQTSGGYGLFSIRERLRHFGGELKIRSKPGEGTRVVMTAPRLMKNDISDT